MSHSQNINYPPEEVREPKFEKKNFEHIILWMLKNNDKVEWSDFKEEPIEIAQSTLSNYMNRLLNKGFIEKIERGLYQITSKGENRFNELSREKEAKRNLSYPPEIISRTRNYEDIILWMAYNNNYLKWSDFLDERAPIFINQSSLSKNVNLLKDNNYITKDENTKEYRITNLGKIEYSRMLKSYDLDRQSILDEESKRIEEITKRTIGFFEKYGIIDDDIKFRFLNNILTLSFERIKGSLDSEEDFNKVLLYLSMNHPNQYPNYISFKEFSEQFDIDSLDLEFNVRQIVEKDIYSVNFFKLEAEEDKIYFFQVGEKLEKVLSAITEDHITKFTYLNKLYQNTLNGVPSISLNYTVDSILNEICNNLFHEGLKKSLKKFLPDYIKYLAYRIETERKLVDTLDKLEGVAWRDIPEVFQSYSSRYQLVEQAQFKYSIDYTCLKVLKLFESSEIEKMFEDLKHMMKKKDFDDALDKLDLRIDAEPDNLDLIFLKAIVLSVANRHHEAIRFLKEEFRDHPNKNEEDIYIPYNYIKVYCYMTLNQFDKASRISNKLIKSHPEHPSSFIMKALIQGVKIIYELEKDDLKIEQVFLDLDKAVSLEDRKKNIAKYYYFKALILMHLKKFEEALETVNLGLDLDPKGLYLHYMKYKVLYEYDKIDEALRLVDEGIKLFPDERIKLIMHMAYLYKKRNKYDKSLEIIDDLLEENPEDVDVLNNKLYYHLYNGEKEEAVNTGKKMIKLDPEDGNLFDSYAEALTEFGDYEKAIKIAKKALENDPLGWFTYNTYFQLARCYKETGQYKLARENLEKGESATHTCFCGVSMRKELKEKKFKMLEEIEKLELKS